MLTQWLIDYWWILVTVLCILALAVTMWVLGRRGTLKKTWPKISFAVTCVLILLIPFMPTPGSYCLAILAVSNLLIVFSGTFTSEKSPEGADQPATSATPTTRRGR